MKPGTCNKSTETDNKTTQTDDSFTEYLKQQTQEKQQEPPKGKPQEKGNPSCPGQTLKPATLEMIRKDEEKKKKEEKDSFPQRKIDLQTELQATVISVTLDKEITICSVYIPPSFSLNSQHLDSLLQQLPSPYIILGDFNGHNILWGGKNNDSRGELIENFLTKMIYVL